MEVYSYNPLTGLKKMSNWGLGPQILGVFVAAQLYLDFGPTEPMFLCVSFVDIFRSTAGYWNPNADIQLLEKVMEFQDLPWN